MNKMKKINLHTHGKYSDGKGELIDFVKSAIKKEMNGIGFSSHSPLPIDNGWSMKLNNLKEYISDVNNLKKNYQDEINVYLGLELDYIEKLDIRKYINFEQLNLDYYIGAVHYIYIDKSKTYKAVDDYLEEFIVTLKDDFNNDIGTLYTKYYETYRMMIEEYKPKIIAHLDLVKKNNKDNKFFNENESKYIEEVLKTLDIVKKHDCVLEINTGGLSRGYTKEVYPSSWILNECKKRNIKITINADAHSCENVDYMFDYAINKAKEAGYENIYLFNGNNFIKSLI